ncbi:MAG: ABC transporter substrate-binding protein [Gammaproteobacteria bacterium]|nr:ABC transporter substrate-binding protein [Gammaproteobacteria bacterium]
MSTIKWVFILGVSLILFGCNQSPKENTLVVATSGEYPPFEYLEKGELKGFDIDLATLVAAAMGKTVVFENMQFSSILPALDAKQVDIAISTITITPARAAQFSLSRAYFYEQMAMVYKQDGVIHGQQDLCQQKVAVQLGTTMAIWMKTDMSCAELVLMNSNPLAIEALKAGHVGAVVMDGTQAKIFSQHTVGLAFQAIGKAKDGYGIALVKDSKLLPKINEILIKLEQSGQIEKLKKKWLGE